MQSVQEWQYLVVKCFAARGLLIVLRVYVLACGGVLHLGGQTSIVYLHYSSHAQGCLGKDPAMNTSVFRITWLHAFYVMVCRHRHSLYLCDKENEPTRCRMV